MLSVHRYRIQLEEEGYDEITREKMVREYALEKKKKNIEYQKEVLGRMIKKGCRPCERKRQQKYIEELENEIA